MRDEIVITVGHDKDKIEIKSIQNSPTIPNQPEHTPASPYPNISNVVGSKDNFINNSYELDVELAPQQLELMNFFCK